MAERHTPRDPRLIISVHLARCEPAACAQKAACARFLAPVMRNGSMKDFSYDVFGPKCLYFVTVDDAKLFGLVSKSTQPKEWIGSKNA